MPQHDDRYSLDDESRPEVSDEPVRNGAGTYRWLLILALGSWVIVVLLALLLKGG